MITPTSPNKTAQATPTPGPWSYTPSDVTGDGFYVHAPGKWIKMVHVEQAWSRFDNSDQPAAETEANAKLIAAAPELLAALKKFHAWSQAPESASSDSIMDCVEAAVAAIQKAEGRSA